MVSGLAVVRHILENGPATKCQIEDKLTVCDLIKVMDFA